MYCHTFTWATLIDLQSDFGSQALSLHSGKKRNCSINNFLDLKPSVFKTMLKTYLVL